MKIWLAIQKDDNDCYNLIERTKKDLIERVRYINSMNDNDKFAEAFHIDVDCSDVYQLIYELTDEGGGRNRYMGEVLSHFLIKDGKFIRIPNDSNISGTDLVVYRTRTVKEDGFSKVEKDIWNLKTKKWETKKN